MPHLPNPMIRLRKVARWFYDKGYSDRRISGELNCARKYVRRWREENQLAPAYRGTHRPILMKQGFELIEKGWSDREIAEYLEQTTGNPCDRCTVGRWRKSQGIEANCKVGSEDWYAKLGCVETNSEVMRLCENGCSDKEGAAIMGITTNAFNCRRRKLGLRANSLRKVN